MSGQKVKIAARLRPRLPQEIDDGAVEVIHASDSEVSLSDGNTGKNRSGSFIAVPNPRDPTQIFKFPSVTKFSTWTSTKLMDVFAQIHFLL
jgi:kinesin family protein 22